MPEVREYNYMKDHLHSSTCRQWNVLDYQAGQERLMCVLPLFHIYGNVVIMMIGLASGASIVTLPKFDPEIFLSSIQKHKVILYIQS